MTNSNIFCKYWNWVSRSPLISLKVEIDLVETLPQRLQLDRRLLHIEITREIP